jgi:hypothetical protein
MSKSTNIFIEIMTSIAIVIYMILSLSVLFTIILLKWVSDKLIAAVTISPKEEKTNINLH